MKENQVEFERLTVRLHPKTLQDVNNFLEESPDFRNTSQFVRAAVKEYLRVNRPQKIETSKKQPSPGKPSVTIRLTLPLTTYRKVVWQAENQYHTTPLDLMFRFINDEVMNFTYEDAKKYLKSDRDFAVAEAEKNTQEEEWLDI